MEEVHKGPIWPADYFDFTWLCWFQENWRGIRAFVGYMKTQ